MYLRLLKYKDSVQNSTYYILWMWMETLQTVMCMQRQFSTVATKQTYINTWKARKKKKAFSWKQQEKKQ